MRVKSKIGILALFFLIPQLLISQTPRDSTKAINVLDYDNQDKPITKEDIEIVEGTDNRVKKAVICLPVAAGVGAVVFIPVGCCVGWAATGFQYETQYCCGVPVSVEPVINSNAMWATVITGSAVSAIIGAMFAYKLGRSLDRRLAIEGIKKQRAQNRGEQGEIRPTGIWYISASSIEYGYNDMLRYTGVKFVYIFVPVRFGFGLEAPGWIKYQGHGYPNQEFTEYDFLGPGLYVYVLPWYQPWQMGDINFISSCFLYAGNPNTRQMESPAPTLPYIDIGLGLASGTLITVKGGVLAIGRDFSSLQWKPYATVEVAWGSWFYTGRYQKNRY